MLEAVKVVNVDAKRGESRDETNLPSVDELIRMFVDQHVSEFRETMRQRILSDFSAAYAQEVIEGDLEDYVAKEICFVTAVINAYFRWAEEEDPIVLWDIDDTLGRYRASKAEFANEFRLRSSIFLLLQFLHTQFPNVRNGLLSNRIQLETQIAEGASLAEITPYLDTDHLYSSRKVVINKDEETFLRDEMSLEVNDDVDLQKWKLCKALKDGALNIKVIDDNGVAKSMGEDGVWVYNFMARY